MLTPLVQMIWGPEGMTFALPEVLNGQVQLLYGVEFPVYRVLIISVGLLVALALYLVVSHTRTGMLIRAGASNRRMVEALGVDIRMLFTLVFAAGAAMAGLAGLMIAPITEASIGMGNEILIVAFVVIVIGGIGSVQGAFFWRNAGGLDRYAWKSISGRPVRVWSCPTRPRRRRRRPFQRC